MGVLNYSGFGRSPRHGYGLLVIAIAVMLAMALALIAPGQAEAAQTKQGTFTKATATGSQNITGVGFQPKAVIFYWTRQTNINANNAGLNEGYGFAADGTPISQGSVVAAGMDNLATTDANSMISSTYAIEMLNWGAAGTPMVARASVTAFGADGFTLNWATNEARADYIHYIAIGGPDITNAIVGTFLGPAVVTNPFNVTGVGFQPDMVFFMSSNRTGTTEDAIITEGSLNLGFMTSTGSASTGWAARDAQTVAANGHTWSAVNAITGVRRNAVDQQATYVSMNTDGFSLNFTQTGGAARYYYLAIKGGLHKVGAFTKRTSFGSQSVTGVGFQPVGAMFMTISDNVADATIRTVAPASSHTIGTADTTNTYSSIWANYRPVINSDANTYSYNNVLMKMGVNTNGTITDYGQSTFTSFDVDGFTLNWSTSDATARNVVYWTLGTSCIDSDPASGFTINPPTSGTTITMASSYLIQATVAGETSAPGTGTATITIAGTDAGACDVTGAAMTWNPGNSKWEYNWNIAACGTTVADGGITIDATYTDPDCSGMVVVNATQISNITIDNVCNDNDPTTGFTINPPTNGTIVSGNYVIRGTVAGETTPGAPGSAASITIAGSSTCNVTGAAMTWNGTSGKWEYTWNTGACGNPVESGITIDASYTDPNCFDVTPATQVSSIGIDNTDPYSIIGCGGCHLSPPADSATRNTPEGTVKGSHNVHGNELNLACTECHVDNGIAGNSFPKGLAHRTGIINMTTLINSAANSSYSGGTTITQTKTPALGVCYNTYCHSNGTSLTSPWVSNSPTWGGTATCTTCHQKPPAYANGAPKANSHGKHSTNCSFCHNATTSDGGNTITGPASHGNKIYNVVANAGQFASYTAGTKTCNNVCCHGGTSPVWGGAAIGCTTCHNGSVCSPEAEGLDAAVTSRRAVSGEFGMTWSHKRTAGGTVTSSDCGVCHMEGIASTGLSNSTYHANGYVELRDPDTGSTIMNVAWAGPNAGAYANTTDVGKFVRFSRDLASSTLEPAVIAIQVNHCLKCHDAGGAASSAARVPSGTALRPFNTAPTHTPGNNVLNVDAHFNTTNSSYHPVKGKQNNSYVDIDLMRPPFNQWSKGGASTTAWGDLISCWDCHAPDGTASTVTLTNTVTAHGGATTLRGASTVSGTPSVTNAAKLCMLCHDTTTYVPGTAGHGPNSAASNLNRSEKTPFLQYGCNVCHSSGYNTAATRPTRSEDVHGTNTLPATGQTLSGRWLSAGTPIAFIRNRSYLGDHSPKQVGATTYTIQCNMVGTDGNGVCTNQGAKAYTVGGTY